MPYSKPWLSDIELVARLKNRGLKVDNDELCIQHLRRVGYYRLSGYLYPYRKIDPAIKDHRLDEFEDNTHFSDVIELYIFDKQLRLLALDALERIEIAVRVEIGHLLGEKDPFAHHNMDLLDRSFALKKGDFGYASWMFKYTGLVRQSSEPFIEHIKRKYGLPLPIWAAVEVWDFGALSLFYSGLKGNDRDQIAEKFKVPNGRAMTSWLRSLNFLRNVCAHHSRLWNRNMVESPRIKKLPEFKELLYFTENQKLITRSFSHFCLIQWFMKEICPRSQWGKRFCKHLSNFPVGHNGYRSLAEMGCPGDWKTWDLWK
jgi:abortive infection bacteriophage resistance protein